MTLRIREAGVGMVATLLAFVLTLGSVRGARAQVGAAPPPAAKLVQAGAARVKLGAGATDRVIVHLVLLPGWHVNANPPARAYNIPTKVRLYKGAGLTSGAARYPAGASRKFAFEDST